MLNLCLIVHAKPYLDKEMNNLDVFNEIVALAFFVSMQGFVLFEAHALYKLGWVSLAILVLFMMRHMSINILSTIKSLLNSCKNIKLVK